MRRKRFKYLYGPVPSWRLGSSLGVDLLSQKKKICTFDCIYCQLGATTKACTLKRKIYVPSKKIIQEIKALPKVHIDYITFSGRGEPTLAKNLGQLIRAIKKIRPEPIAVLTNASLLSQKSVRKELLPADLVAVKLDVDAQALFRAINQPGKKVSFSHLLQGIRQLRKEYRGRLALQIMLLPQNTKVVQKIAKLVKTIQPDEIHLCTPTRPSPVLPLSRKTVSALKKYFRGMQVISLYDVKCKKTRPIDKKGTTWRRGKAL